MNGDRVMRRMRNTGGLILRWGGGGILGVVIKGINGPLENEDEG